MIKHQPKALEMKLVKEAGYALADLRGRTEQHTVHRERQGLVAWLRRRIPWLADPTLIVERHEVHQPGMKRREVLQRAIQHDEHESIKAEQRRKQARKAEQQAKQGGA